MTKSLILLLAGTANRFNKDEKEKINKVLYQINNIPLYIYSLDKFYQFDFNHYYLVVNKDDYNEVEEYLSNTKYQNINLVIGGNERQESVINSLKLINDDYVLIHDAARPLISSDDIKTMLDMMSDSLCGTMYKESTNTLRYVDGNKIELLDRNKIYQISTPQFFNKCLYQTIINNTKLITDEISLFEDKNPLFIKETSDNIKLTNRNDLDYIKYELSNKYNYRIGHSLDYHKFSKTGTLLLGGILFKDYPSLDGHSDADVIYHSVAESILGACSLGDLGDFFPDNDPNTLGIKSSYILSEVVKKITNLGYEIVNIDIMVYLKEPKLKDYKKEMALNISNITNCNNVCVKAATLNKLDLLTQVSGIGSETVVLVKK